MELDIKTLEQLKAIFTAEQFVITGSTAVRLLGFKTKNGSKDIDIVLYNPTDSCRAKLKEFQEQFPADRTNSYTGVDFFQFVYNDIKFDIFIDAERQKTDLSYKGFLISTMDALVRAKKSYSSPKHIFQMMNWRDQIISDADLTNFYTINF